MSLPANKVTYCLLVALAAPTGNTTLLALRKTLHPRLAALAKSPPALLPFLPAATRPKVQASPPQAFTATTATPPPKDSTQPRPRAT